MLFSCKPILSPRFSLTCASPWRYVRSFKGMPKEGPMPQDGPRNPPRLFCLRQLYRFPIETSECSRSIGRTRNTIIALVRSRLSTGDHGMWCAHHLRNLDSHPSFRRSPIIEKTNACPRVELIDMYQILADMATADQKILMANSKPVPENAEPDKEETVAYTISSRKTGYSAY